MEPTFRKPSVAGVATASARPVQVVCRVRAVLCVLLSSVALVLAGCSREQPSAAQPAGQSGASPPPLQVVATVGMVGDVARAVAGQDAAITVLMGPGTDPHLYKPTPSDMRLVRDADLVLASGLKLEGKMQDVLEEFSRSKPVMFITDAIPRDKLIVANDAGKLFDPHVWFDVALWSTTIAAVRDALVAQRPQHRDVWTARAQAYEQQLITLHERAKAALATIPRDRRVLVTAHDAFGYFGRAYDVQVLGVQGISTESEASLQGMNELVDLLVTRQIPAIFVESSINPKSIEGLQQGAAARGHRVIIGGELFSDAMGELGTPEGTYQGMITHNVMTIVTALGGNASMLTQPSRATIPPVPAPAPVPETAPSPGSGGGA